MKLSIVIIIGLSACSIQTDSHQPKVLKVSVQPSQSNQNDLKLLYFPLMKYLEKELSIKIVWVKVNNYQHQLDKFHNGELDLALFGGFAFVKALARDNADPLVGRSRYRGEKEPASSQN